MMFSCKGTVGPTGGTNHRHTPGTLLDDFGYFFAHVVAAPWKRRRWRAKVQTLCTREPFSRNVKVTAIAVYMKGNNGIIKPPTVIVQVENAGGI